MLQDTDYYEALDDLFFADEDERDAAEADHFREIVTGLPARPGTRR